MVVTVQGGKVGLVGSGEGKTGQFQKTFMRCNPKKLVILDVWDEEVKNIFAVSHGMKTILWRREEWKKRKPRKQLQGNGSFSLISFMEKVHILRKTAWESWNEMEARHGIK